MSFVEGISAASIDIADPAFAACVGGIVLVLSLLVAAPAVATVLRWLHPESLGKLWHFISARTLGRWKH